MKKQKLREHIDKCEYQQNQEKGLSLKCSFILSFGTTTDD